MKLSTRIAPRSSGADPAEPTDVEQQEGEAAVAVEASPTSLDAAPVEADPTADEIAGDDELSELSELSSRRQRSPGRFSQRLSAIADGRTSVIDASGGLFDQNDEAVLQVMQPRSHWPVVLEKAVALNAFL